MMNYIFGGNTGISSPQELAQRREMQRAIQARSVGRVPQDPWEGLNAIASAIGGRVEDSRIDAAETKGKATAESAYAPIAQVLAGKGTPDIGTITGALSNEWLNPGQRSLAEMLYKQQVEATAPANVLDRRYKEAQINNLENPQLTPYQRESLAIEKARIAQAGATSGYGANPIWAAGPDGKIVQQGMAKSAKNAPAAASLPPDQGNSDPLGIR